MRHFFSFLLILSILTTSLLETATVDARRHDSLTEAAALHFAQSRTISIPAHASQYFYFSLSTSVASSNLQISCFTTVSSVKITACDSKGTSLSLSRRVLDQQITYQFQKKLQPDHRYFLRLHNMAGQTVKCRLKLTNFKSVTTPRKNKRPTATAKPAHTSPAKETPTKEPSSRKPSTKKPPTKQPTTTKTVTARSKTSLSLKTHFLRLKSKHSLALIESLTDLKIPKVILQCQSPDIVSIQNGILYGKKQGIAVILIKTNSVTTSCTVKID